MKTFLKWFIVILFIFVIIFILLNKKSTSQNNNNLIKIKDVILKADFASNPILQMRGLSGRKSLKEDEGMLFLFDKVGEHSFWMKDMNFPIDIIWFDENNKIVFIKKNALPESFPNTYGPNRDTKYVLEVVSGFSDKYDLQIGDQLYLSI